MQLLRAAGHYVVTPAEAGTSKVADQLHFRYALTHQLVLLTKDTMDFQSYHDANPEHPGVLVIYQDNDPHRDMTYNDVVRAIANLENAGVELKGTFQSLNAWRY